MSDIEEKHKSKVNGHHWYTKRNIRVDLTPMVDLGFLLITFFVFTTTLAQPTVMQVNSPNDENGAGDNVCESCVLTLLLAKGNTVQYYEGRPGNNTVVQQTSLTRDGIREVIIQKKYSVSKARKTADQLVLIIKSADESTFQNFVDILDEVAINNVKRYYIGEIEPWDRKIFQLER